MQQYCFTKLRRALDDQGYEPDFPEGVEYLLLADAKSSDWNLYEYSSDESNKWSPSHPVSEELEALLESAKRFPPALALTRCKIASVFQSKEPSLNEFSERIAETLWNFLSVQSSSNFIFAAAKNNEIGYLHKSEWYWIVSVSKSDPEMVNWVSDDFFIYTNPINDFELTEQQIDKLKSQNQV